MDDRAHPNGRSRASGNPASLDCAAGALLGAGAVVVWNDIKPEGREAFYAWHDKEHVVERLALPGFRRGRRYRKAGHSPEWLTLYEANDLDALQSPEYLARLNAPTPQTTATLVHFANTSRAVCRVGQSVGTSSGGYVLALRLDGLSSPRRREPSDVAARDTGFPPARERQGKDPGSRLPPGRQDDERALIASVFADAIACNGIVACHHLVTDADASYVKTAESSTRKFDVPVSVILVEATHETAAENARALFDASPWASLGLALRADAAIYALEICRLARGHPGTPQHGED